MPPKNSSKLKWTISDLKKVFLLEVALIAIALSIGEALFGEGAPLSHFEVNFITMILFLMQSLALLIPLYFFTIYKYRSHAGDYGLVRIPFKTLLKRVGQGFLIYYIVSAIFMQIQLSYDIEIPGYGTQNSHVPLFGDSPEGLLMGAFIVIILAPFVEELFFRGYVYQTLRKYGGVFSASVFSAIIFAFFHLEFQIFIPIFILGLVLNWIFEHSRSLWAPVAFHVFNNFLAFMLEIAIYFEWIDLQP